jgi:pilus assembly protein CpaB
MERTNRRLLLLALLFALLLGLGIYRFLDNLQSATVVKNTDQVIIATRDIPARTVISAEMVSLQRVPIGTRHPQAAASLEQVLGKVTTEPLVAAEQVLSGRLFASAEASGLAFQLPSGKRAVSIGINSRIAVAYLVRPGDAVDVLISYETATTREPHTAVMLQNIIVLAVGGEMKQGSRAPEDSETITLAVTPAQAEQLTWAEDYGRIRLALRPATDQQLVATPGQKAITVAGGK